MTAPYPYLAISSQDQWRRVAHKNTTLLIDQSGLSLAEEASVLDGTEPESVGTAIFSAFDPYCRLYVLNEATSEVMMLRDNKVKESEPIPVFSNPDSVLGEFNLHEHALRSNHFSGLALDSAGHLFLAEASKDCIWVFDLQDRRLIRQALLPTGAAPRDSDADAMDVYVVTNSGLGVLTASSDFRLLNGLLEGQAFDRVCACGGEIFVLENANTESAKVIAWNQPELMIEAPFASDIMFSAADRLVIAFEPEQSFRQYFLNDVGGTISAIFEKYLRAKGYRGDGIFRALDSRIAYHSEKGIRYALPVKPRYQTRGRVVSFALDSGVFQNRWGLAFIDACIPRNCQVRAAFFSSDELDEDFLLARTVANNDSEVDSPFGDLLAPERSPSMPPDTAFENFSNNSIEQATKLYRRSVGDELIWDEYFESEMVVTYETPVFAKPGRFLWVMLELRGTEKVSPRVMSLRIQKQGHQLLNHLPKFYSRDDNVQDYLRRYLALPESILNEFDISSLTRQVMLDPYSSREEWLSWLAGFLGMSFDERFLPQTRRQLIEEAAWLFRFRGTVAGLERFIQIYADHQLGAGTVVQIVERFKFRGHAGLQDPSDNSTEAGAVLGVDYRLGAGVNDDESSLDESELSDPYAHRFIVLIAANLSVDESDIVNLIIQTHRPAHTAFEVCTVDAGMRIGRGLYLELNSFVGQSAGFQTVHLGSGTLGRDGILGIPKTASTSTGGRLGQNARLG